MSKRAASDWRRLDNAAKIFPSATSKADTKVFRFSSELTEPVDQYYLQDALNLTLEDFPTFRCVLKRGLFWYYLEEADAAFLVQEENAPPCSTMYHDSRSPLFSATFYQNRINLEVYHVLTDGAGALQFLKALTYNYLLLAHPELKGHCAALDFDASTAQRMDDSFAKYYTGKSDLTAALARSRVPVYALKGAKTAEWRLKIVEGIVPADAVVACARNMGVSVTAFLAAALICAIKEEMSERDKGKSVVVSIPINLHKYFPSQTVRNFFSVVNIGYCFEGNSGALPDVAAALRDRLAETLGGEYLQKRLDMLAELEHWMVARIIPLFIKNIVLKRFYKRSEKEYTTTLSNLGTVVMPEALRPFIRRIDVFNSTKDMQVCLCSYENALSISFTSRFLSNDIQRRFFRTLSGMGIPVEIVANRFEGMGESL